jgi:hypothetical protein
MRTLTITSVLALSIALLGSSAWAQSTTAKKPVAKSTSKSAPAKAAPAAAAAVAAKPLTEEQVSIAQIVTTGRIACADGQSVTITADPKINGAFDVMFGRTKYDVVPMPTKSGAVRLEDTKTGIVFMQLANKSMLFNERQGKRLADDCISPAQQVVADQMKANPTAGVLEGGK